MSERISVILFLISVRLFKINAKIIYISATILFILTSILPFEFIEISLNEKYKKYSNSIILILAKIDQKIILSRDKIANKLKILNKDLDIIIDYLIKENLIETVIIKENVYYTLTNRGNDLYCNVFKNKFILEQPADIEDEIKNLTILDGNIEEESVPSFIGCFVADKQGKALLTFEIFDGALETYLRRYVSEDERKNLDIQLIPLFLSALEKFSKTINIRNLSGFKITGTNIKIQTFTFSNSMVSFFINPDVNLKPIKKKIIQYFKHIFSKYEEDFELSIRTGIINNLEHLNENGRRMLQELNKFVYLCEFKNIIDTLDDFDLLYAVTLKSKLKKLQNDFKLKFSIINEKIKILESSLDFAIQKEDIEQLREIIKKAQQIESNLSKF